MHNNIKPAWIFCGVFLVTLLWALEFDNRPRTRLAIPYSSDHLNSSTIEQVVTQSDRGNELESKKFPANLGQLAQADQSERTYNLQPHRDSLLSDSSRNLLIDSANRQLPAQEQVFASKGSEPVEPLRDNNPLHAADRLYSCFGNSCLNVIADH